MRLTAKQVTWLKVSLHLAGLLPFLCGWSGRSITVDWVRSGERYSAFTGRTALKFLLATCYLHLWHATAERPLLIRTRRLLSS